MKKTSTPLLLVACALTAGTAQAVEFGSIRALQHGPIGDSPQFADINRYEAEAAVSMTRSYGDEAINDDPALKVAGSAIHTNVAVGGGWAPTKNFTLTGYIDATLASDSDEEQDRSSPKSHLDTGLYQHQLNVLGLYKTGPLVFGGGLGVLLFGSESREFNYDGKTYKDEVSSAAMPTMSLFGGVTTKPFDGTIGLRLFSKGNATVKGEGPTGKTEYDVTRRSPGEIHADARLKFAQARIAASVAYLLTSQASEQVDEFSQRYETGKKSRATGGARRSADTFKVSVGGRFDPIKMIGILGGITYVSPSYAKEQYASLEHENLGGLRLDLGTEVRYEMYRGFFQAGYTLDSTASYTQEGDSRAGANADQTQRAPVNQGDKVKVTQGAWDVVIGGGIVL